jgi:hypothetical protein
VNGKHLTKEVRQKIKGVDHGDNWTQRKWRRKLEICQKPSFVGPSFVDLRKPEGRSNETQVSVMLTSIEQEVSSAIRVDRAKCQAKAIEPNA